MLQKNVLILSLIVNQYLVLCFHFLLYSFNIPLCLFHIFFLFKRIYLYSVFVIPIVSY